MYDNKERILTHINNLITGGIDMNTASVRKINHAMKRFEREERNLITRIDVRAKANEAEESTMDKHLVRTNDQDERTWRF